jgi:hypothetical protein
MRLSAGLLEAGVLHYLGREEEAQARLAGFTHQAREPWFAAVGDYLLGRTTEDELRRQAADLPEQIITGFAAAGFWAEGSRDPKAAMRFYRDALASFMDNWVEYDFVRERIKRLRKPGE